jgi:hypothetical protein
MFWNSPNIREKHLISWAKSHKIELPQNPDELKNVSKIDLRFKGLDKLPKEIDCLPNLVEIDAEFNELAELPWEFAQLKKITNINLGHNKFTDIPGMICKHTQIESLNFEANYIKKLTPVIANLSSLKYFNLSFNLISDLPSDFGHLSHLVYLNIACNNLSSLPSSFIKLYNLAELKIWKNQFNETPDFLKEMPNLKKVDLVIDETKINNQFIQAVIYGDVALTEKYLALGADINYRWSNYNNYSFTNALFEAKSVEMVKLLLNRGSDITLKREKIATNNDKPVEFETFLTKKHSPDVLKYLKSINLIAK